MAEGASADGTGWCHALGDRLVRLASVCSPLPRRTSGPFFTLLQIFAGITLVAVTVPFLWKLVRTHMLWSLRNKLVLTYLLIGLAPVVLFVTLASVLAYVAAGQFAIHLVDSRIQTELNQMTNETAHRTDLVTQTLNDRPNDSPEQFATAIQNLERGEEFGKIDRVGNRLRRETRVFINGAPVDLGSNPRGKAPLGLPPWATELPGGQFSGLVLDSGELYLVSVHQKQWNDRRIFTLMSSVPVDGALMTIVAEGLGRARMLPERAGNTSSESELRPVSPEGSQTRSVRPTAPHRERQEATVAIGPSGVTGRPWTGGGTQPLPINVVDVPVSFTSTEPIYIWDTGERDNCLIAVESRPSLLYNQLFGSSLGGIVTSVLRIAIIILCLVFALIELLALWMAIRLSRTITTSVTDLYRATKHIDSGDLDYRIGVKRNDQLAELSRSFNKMAGSLKRLLVEQKEKERLQNEISIAQEVPGEPVSALCARYRQSRSARRLPSGAFSQR